MPKLSEILGVNVTSTHPNSRVASALARAGVSKTSELVRVANLPRRKFDVSTYPDCSVIYAKNPCGRTGCQYCKYGSPSLRPLQSAIIIEAANNAGAFVAAGVGTGKTLASFLLHDALEVQTTVLLVPPSLRDKTLNIDLPELEKHFTLPNIYSGSQWQKDKPGVYVLGYSEISQTDASDLLDKIKPDLIVADEVQALKRRESARTRRFLRFMRANSCKFVAMTGSPITNSIMDFSHLMELALGKGSPLPVDYPSLAQWADAIDHEGEEGATGMGALALMCEDYETARDGFRRRFVETPGVIATEETSCSLPIEIREFVITDQTCQDSINKLESEWAWDGEEYTEILAISRLQRQLTQGYFYRIKWPGGIPDREWLEAKNGWNRAVRARLKHSNRVGQDSPALLEKLASEGLWITPEWLDWLAQSHKPEPEREPVVISDWLVKRAVHWAGYFNTPGIIWVSSPVIGRQLQKHGIMYFGEGQDQELNALAKDALDNKQAGTPSFIPTIACSIQAHGTGKNLQAWSRNLVLYPPAGGDVWEQLVGRTHRPGQLDSCVTFDVVLGSDSALKSWENACSKGKFIQETTGLIQRLNIAQNVDSIGDDRLG
jgi:hypothetical protein